MAPGPPCYHVVPVAGDLPATTSADSRPFSRGDASSNAFDSRCRTDHYATEPTTRPGGNGSGDRPLDTDAVFDALADERRRRVVRVLRSADGAMGIEELARHVVARERGTTVPSVPSRDARRVAGRLYHGDVPKLEKTGLVEYDGGRERVRSLVDPADLSTVLAHGLERPGR